MFLRGINKAIRDHLGKSDQMRILYGGCGPFATVLTPITSVFSPGEVQFTFLEIEPKSVESVKRLYAEWGLEAYLKDIRLEDATDPTLSFVDRFGIIVSEAMQAGLRTECQVPITRNLVRFLGDGGHFIPGKISLDAYLVSSCEPNSDARDEEFLGTAFELDFRSMSEGLEKISIPIVDSELEVLELRTRIDLYGDVGIANRESGLTSPIILEIFKERRPKRIEFEYVGGLRPNLEWDCVY